MTDFAEAMSGILKQQRWRRKDWGRPLHVCVWNTVELGHQVVMTMHNGQQGAWSPSQCDMLARDWYWADGV